MRFFYTSIKVIVILMFFILSKACSSIHNMSYFDKNKEYHYRALYIDSRGDTITNEILIIKPLGRGWFPQLKLQQAIKYIYNTDTIGYKKYKDPESYFRKRDSIYYIKKGRIRYPSKQEITGAVYTKSEFYMHPPRTNQYRMLFYAAHPSVPLDSLKNVKSTYNTGLIIPLMGTFDVKYKIMPLKDTTINKYKVKVWQMKGENIGDIKEYNKIEGIYNSSIDAVFCKEYGFVRLHYIFENNVKIYFDLTKIVVL